MYLFAAITLLAAGCTEHGKINGNIISLEEVLGNVEEIALSKYASKIEYVLLDNSDSVMLPGVKDLQIKGAGEFTRLRKVYVDPAQRTFIISDPHKLITYSFEGEFLSEKADSNFTPEESARYNFGATDFISYAEKSNSPKMKEAAAKLTEDSNPVLIVVTLK